MGFIVRLHQPSEQRPLKIGRVPTAADAFHLQNQWREEHPESWVEIISARNFSWDDAA